MSPKSELAKRLAVAVQALSEALTNKAPACEHIARQELQSILNAVDEMATAKDED
jgi:hypothetical protein